MVTFTLDADQLILTSHCLFTSGPLYEARQLRGQLAGSADAAESWGRPALRTRRLLFDPISKQDMDGLRDWAVRVCLWSAKQFTVTGPDWNVTAFLWMDEIGFPLLKPDLSGRLELTLLEV